MPRGASRSLNAARCTGSLSTRTPSKSKSVATERSTAPFPLLGCPREVESDDEGAAEASFEESRLGGVAVAPEGERVRTGRDLDRQRRRPGDRLAVDGGGGARRVGGDRQQRRARSQRSDFPLGVGAILRRQVALREILVDRLCGLFGVIELLAAPRDVPELARGTAELVGSSEVADGVGKVPLAEASDPPVIALTRRTHVGLGADLHA